MAAFLQGLRAVGLDGRPQRAEWYSLDGSRCRPSSWILQLSWWRSTPDIILASSGSVVGPFRRLTRTIPIVFTGPADPVGAGFVELARPGGNVTGFLTFEYGLSVEMAGTAQADRATRDAGCSPARCRHPLRDGPVGRDPVGCAIFRCGAARD